MPSSSASEPTTSSTQMLGGWRLRDDNPNEWIWTPRAQRRHDLSSWLPVDLPASVQETLLRVGQIPDPYVDLNSRAAEWVEHRDWIYALDLDVPPPQAGRRTFIEFESVADACLVYLNGARVGEHEGPGAPFDFEIGPLLQEGGNQLFLVVRSPHQEEPQTGWTEHTRSLRGRMGFGWDFAPRLVSIGVLGAITLRHTGAHRLRDLRARPHLDAGLRSASVDLSVRVDGPAGAQVRFTVRQGRRSVGSVTAQADGGGLAHTSIEIADLQVWWPNGMGAQPLYRVAAECADGSDRAECVFGLRNIEWDTQPGGSPGEWPLTLVVNSRRVFQRGWNWVPADCMGGPRSIPIMKRLVGMARDAGANILRCWGGADPETPAFYDECDRHGILVWQEFPMSSSGISNVPPSDESYLERMAHYARDVVALRRNHPSLALWGGGNELSGLDGKPLTLEHPYARCLAAVVSEHDPGRAFRPSSPLGPTADADPSQPVQWDVHGPWEYSQRYPGPQYWRINDIAPALHSETGAPGMASLAARRRCLSPAHRTPDPANPAWRHHGGAWWDHHATLEQMFGPIEAEALAVLASQWLQAETLRYYIEETRRRWPRSAGIYPWQLNEPWPNVACTSAVEYAGTPKLAYFAVGSAYRPLAATAHYSGLRIEPGEPLRAEIWALNDGEPREAELTVGLKDLHGQTLAPEGLHRFSLAANSSRHLLDFEIPLPGGFSGVMLLELTLESIVSRYIFTNAPQPWLRSVLDYPEALAGMFNVGANIADEPAKGGMHERTRQAP